MNINTAAIKHKIKTLAPDVLLGAALVAATATVTLLIHNKDEEDNEYKVVLTMDDFQRMNDKHEALIIRNELGFFEAHKSD